jgi:ACS family tartrate transporter-like MFS transporter
MGFSPSDAELDDPLGQAILRKISWRLLPLLALGYAIAYMDRINVSFAALQMNQDLHFSAATYGLGAGLFSLSYCLLEVPSNLLLARVGARRWISRIMLTWGLLAIGMLLVKTPAEFYVARFCLGAAEAGFFPGVLYFLKGWYPPAHSGRAISRFYIAVPLGAALLGAVSGPILALSGVAGLAGWQWLFLLEGAPAVLLSAAIYRWLPDRPAQAGWLHARELDWLNAHLTPAETPREPTLPAGAPAWRDPVVLRLGAGNFFILAANYAFALSAPTVLREATHFGVAPIGWVMSGGALLGGVAMLVNGWHSDRYGDRHAHVALPLGLMAASMAIIAVHPATVAVVLAYATYYIGTYAVQAAFWPIPSDALRGRRAAVGLAVIGSVGMFGGFVGPYSFGLLRDFSGSYRTGLLTLTAVYCAMAFAFWAQRPRRAAALKAGAKPAAQA